MLLNLIPVITRAFKIVAKLEKAFKIFQETYMDLHWIVIYFEDKKIQVI